MTLTLDGLTKRFGSFTALDGVSAELPSGRLTALLGPSGCGKTTLLRCLAGLEQPEEGRLLFDGVDQSRVPSRERRVGFVFQHYALFRHLSVFENVAFGLRVRPRAQRPSETEVRRRVLELLALVQLEQQQHKWPSQLSGGQRQRVALARSLIIEPRVLLLDEPFGALDANVRKDLRRWLRRLVEQLGITTVLVTHDQEEALEAADRVLLMDRGRLQQAGSPEDLYLRPANRFVYEFLGSVNVFHGRLQGDRFQPAGSAPPEGLTPAYVRDHDIEVLLSPGEGSWPSRLRHITFLGGRVRLELDNPEGQAWEAALSLEEYQRMNLCPGLQLYLRPRAFRTFLEPGL